MSPTPTVAGRPGSFESAKPRRIRIAAIEDDGGQRDPDRRRRQAGECMNADRRCRPGPQQQKRDGSPPHIPPDLRQEGDAGDDLEHEDHGNDLQGRQHQGEARHPQHRRPESGVALEPGARQHRNEAVQEARRIQVGRVEDDIRNLAHAFNALPGEPPALNQCLPSAFPVRLAWSVEPLAAGRPVAATSSRNRGRCLPSKGARRPFMSVPVNPFIPKSRQGGGSSKLPGTGGLQPPSWRHGEGCWRPLDPEAVGKHNLRVHGN